MQDLVCNSSCRTKIIDFFIWRQWPPRLFSRNIAQSASNKTPSRFPRTALENRFFGHLSRRRCSGIQKGKTEV